MARAMSLFGRWTAAAVAACLIGLSAASAYAAIPQGAIKWTLDHRAKTITIAVKLEIYPTCDDDTGYCKVDSVMADSIKKQILRIWNRGAHYKCYELKFEVDITLGTDRFNIAADRVGVRIDQSPTPIRSYVHGVGWLFGEWDSDDPADKVVPTNEALFVTTWAFPPARATTYAHEFGHVLGLHDTYEDEGGHSVPIPGAPLDLMNSPTSAISQETYDRLVKRSGVVKDSDLQCGFTAVFSADDIAIPSLAGNATDNTLDVRGSVIGCPLEDAKWQIDGVITLQNDYAQPDYPGDISGEAEPVDEFLIDTTGNQSPASLKLAMSPFESVDQYRDFIALVGYEETVQMTDVQGTPTGTVTIYSGFGDKLGDFPIMIHLIDPVPCEDP
jgi:hypothetical protein